MFSSKLNRKRSNINYEVGKRNSLYIRVFILLKILREKIFLNA